MEGGAGSGELGYIYLNDGWGEEDGEGVLSQRIEATVGGASKYDTGVRKSDKDGSVSAGAGKSGRPQRRLSLRPQDEAALHDYLEQKYG